MLCITSGVIHGLEIEQVLVKTEIPGVGANSLDKGI